MFLTHLHPASPGTLPLLSRGGWQADDTRRPSLRTAIRKQELVHLIHDGKILAGTDQGDESIHRHL